MGEDDAAADDDGGEDEGEGSEYLCEFSALLRL